MTKEKDKGKRELSPTPPIEKRETEKESASLSASARAHARNPVSGLTREEVRFLRSSLEATDRQLLKSYAQEIPHIERAIQHAALRDVTDEALVRLWYASMDMNVWLDKYGEPIRNWCHSLERWAINRDWFNKLRDPDRIPDARTVGSRGRKADNWRGTRKEDIGDVLG